MFDKCNLFEAAVGETCAHGGEGLIQFKRLLGKEEISGSCNFMDFTRMPAGTSVGMHSHNSDEEEYYLILKGTGVMKRDGREFGVKPGDLIRNAPGGSHALRNAGPGELWMFVFELTVRARGDHPSH